MNSEFKTLFTSYIQMYTALNGDSYLKLSILKYTLNYLNYAPIDKKSFLAV